MNNKNNAVIWVLVVLAVVGFLIFLTISGQKTEVNLPENTNNENTEVSMMVLGEENMNIDQNKLKITTLVEGAGAEVKSGDIVSVNYTGKLTDGTTFDSNVLPEFGHVEPFVFQVGAGMVIQGWDAGLLGMKVGEKRTLEIAPEYAYGATGAGGVIPPNATLMFEVELVNIVNNSY